MSQELTITTLELTLISAIVPLRVIYYRIRLGVPSVEDNMIDYKV
jgi:hypothetical protein